MQITVLNSPIEVLLAAHRARVTIEEQSLIPAVELALRGIGDVSRKSVHTEAARVRCCIDKRLSNEGGAVISRGFFVPLSLPVKCMVNKLSNSDVE